MLIKKIVILMIFAIISGCSKYDARGLAFEEIEKRKLTYDLQGLKKSTLGIDKDGAYIFKSAGFFDEISDRDFKELIIHASNTNNFGLVSILLNIDKQVEFEESEMNGQIDKAVEKGFSRTVIMLLDNGAELRSGSLFKAIYKDNYNFVKLIIENGPSYEESEFKEALYVAGRIGNLNAIKAIVDSKKSSRNAIENAIFGGAITEEIEVVKYLVSQGVDINYLDEDQCTALHYLAQDGSVSMIKYMIDSGAKINAECRRGETPLKWAYYGKNTEVIQYLKENGAVKN